MVGSHITSTFSDFATLNTFSAKIVHNLQVIVFILLKIKDGSIRSHKLFRNILKKKRFN